MKLNALLMCREHEAVRVLAREFGELEIDERICSSAEQAMEMLALGYYSALVLDFTLPGASQLARMAHLAPPQRRPVVFAMIDALTGLGNTFQAGANFVLYKPLDGEQVGRSLRAGLPFMLPDRRRSPRHQTEVMVYLRFGDVCPVPALVLELSEDGLSVQAAEPVPAAELALRCILPGTPRMIDGTGEVMWADDAGRAGIRFSHLTPASRRELKMWVAKATKGQNVPADLAQQQNKPSFVAGALTAALAEVPISSRYRS